MREYVLAINPGSTSTKVALFKGTENVIQKNLDHSSEELAAFSHITDQYEYRRDIIVSWMEAEGYHKDQLQAVVGRGGLLRPMPSGCYEVTEAMKADLRIGVQGEHASNLGGIIASSIAESAGVKAYIVDPVSVDEFEEVARVTGMPDIRRKSLVHALNIRAVAFNVAKEMGKPMNELNLVIAHLGGGISIAPLRMGRIIDANDANEMGPMSPERTGSLPVGELAKLCYSGKYTFAEMKPKLRGKGGLAGHLGTNDAREVMKRIEAGDEKAKLVFDAMCYQIAKEIGAMATVLSGKVDAIVLTGGVAYSKYLTDYVTEKVSYIAPVILKPGEDEMWALNEGVMRVMSSQENAKIYENEVKMS